MDRSWWKEWRKISIFSISIPSKRIIYRPKLAKIIFRLLFLVRFCRGEEKRKNVLLWSVCDRRKNRQGKLWNPFSTRCENLIYRFDDIDRFDFWRLKEKRNKGSSLLCIVGIEGRSVSKSFSIACRGSRTFTSRDLKNWFMDLSGRIIWSFLLVLRSTFFYAWHFHGRLRRIWIFFVFVAGLFFFIIRELINVKRETER